MDQENFMQILPLDSLKKLQSIDILTQQGDVKVVSHIFSALLDNRTCALCRDLDGRILQAGDPDYDTFQPPLHNSCRCLFISVTSKDPNPPKITGLLAKPKLVKKFAPTFVDLPEKEIPKATIFVIPKPKDTEDEDLN